MRSPYRARFHIFKYMTMWYVYWIDPRAPSRLCGHFFHGDSAIDYVRRMIDAGA